MENPVLTPSPAKKRRVIALSLAIALIVAAFFSGFNMGKKGYTFTPKEFKIVHREDEPQNVDYNILWSAIDILNKKYIDRPVDQQKILYGAVKGAMAATGDPYTDFFPPQELQSFKTDLKGEFDGIGAEIGKRNGLIVVIAPLDGTPAQRAGVLAKDIIAAVDGKSTQDWSVEEAVSHIRGPKGTEVKLTLVREGKDKPLEVTLKREKIEVKSVKWSIKEQNGKKISVISVSRFGDDTAGLFEKAASDALQNKVSGIVVDLRNDPGGYLQTAVQLSSAWVKQGELVVKEQRTDGSEDYNASGSARLNGIPTVVLINGGSASASEIFAGALHDHKLASLVGEKSFGKGSVQELVDLRGGSAVKVTVAKWITPGGKNLNKDGLNPDFEVKISDEDVSAGRDPQMEKALQEAAK